MSQTMILSLGLIPLQIGNWSCRNASIASISILRKSLMPLPSSISTKESKTNHQYCQHIRLYCYRTSKPSKPGPIIDIKPPVKSGKQPKSSIIYPQFFRKRMSEEEEPYDKRKQAMKGFMARLGQREHMSKAEMEGARKRWMIGQMKKRRFYTIKNKYFKVDIEEPNLLTWAAWEQMRDLNFKDPIAWSYDEIVEHYPVSLERVKKDIKSPSRLHREEDIEWFNEDVRKNLIKLVEDFNNEEIDFPVPLFKTLFNSKNECVLENANGLKNQPFLVPKKRRMKKGPFSDIVSDCESPRTKPALPEGITPIQEVLSKVANFFKELEPMPSHEISKTRPDKYLKSDTFEQNSNDLDGPQEVKSDRENISFLPVNRRDPLKKNTGKIIQKGRQMYDESGDFLFKIP